MGFVDGLQDRRLAHRLIQRRSPTPPKPKLDAPTGTPSWKLGRSSNRARWRPRRREL